jgi:hypothetical protein
MTTKQETEEIQEQERQERIVERETADFYAAVLPYGSADVRAAVRFFVDARLGGDALADAVTEFVDGTDSKLADVDVCYIAYDHVLQMARNKISEVLNYDFCNDGPGIDVYGNYMCTQYDYSEEAKDELIEKLKEADEEQKEEMRDDNMVIAFLREMDIDILKV